jgi:circadian clock protein KaiB
MSDEPPIDDDDNRTLEAYAAARAEARHQFILYVAGTTPQSTRAIVNTRKICEEHLAGRYDLEIIDLGKQPHLAMEAQIIAAPTLLRKSPAPVRRFIGDMSRTDQILAGLGLGGTNPEETSP